MHMRTEPVAQRDRVDLPLPERSLDPAAPVVMQPVETAANDDRSVADLAEPEEPEERPNPLWAVNAALAAFLFAAAMLLASG
jgi:hypothetical protein